MATRNLLCCTISFSLASPRSLGWSRPRHRMCDIAELLCVSAILPLAASFGKWTLSRTRRIREWYDIRYGRLLSIWLGPSGTADNRCYASLVLLARERTVWGGAWTGVAPGRPASSVDSTLEARLTNHLGNLFAQGPRQPTWTRNLSMSNITSYSTIISSWKRMVLIIEFSTGLPVASIPNAEPTW